MIDCFSDIDDAQVGIPLIVRLAKLQKKMLSSSSAFIAYSSNQLQRNQEVAAAALKETGRHTSATVLLPYCGFTLIRCRLIIPLLTIPRLVTLAMRRLVVAAVCRVGTCATYCDDVQDAEQAVDAVSWVHLLHHTLLAILEDERRKCFFSFPNSRAAVSFWFTVELS